MQYTFDTNDRPFKAIKAGTKKVEGRTLTRYDRTPYEKIKKGDTIELINNSTREIMYAEVTFIHHYRDVMSMLEHEGVENVLSGEPKTIKSGVKGYNALSGYKSGIKKYGIYAIGVKPMEQ